MEGKLRWLLEVEDVLLGRIVVVGIRQLENSFLGREAHLTGEDVEQAARIPVGEGGPCRGGSSTLTPGSMLI